MLKKRMKPVMIFLSSLIVLSSFSISMAGTEPSVSAENSKPIIESTDINYQLDDNGIYDMISNIDDPVKREKILDYWTMPAWYDNTTQSTEERNAILLTSYDIVNKLIATPTNLIDGEIDKLLTLNVDMISKDNSKKVFPSFMKILEKRSITNKSKLTNKVAESKGLQFENSSVETKSISPMSNIQKYTTANYTEGSPGGLGYLMINCKVTWNYDTVTKNITYLSPATTTGWGTGRVIFTDQWEIPPSGQWVVDGTADKGVVHKAIKYFVSPDIENPMGYLCVDVVVDGNGLVTKKYANALSAYSNAYSGYSWSTH